MKKDWKFEIIVYKNHIYEYYIKSLSLNKIK